MTKILIPSAGADDWQGFLAKPDLQWKRGYSARALAHCWEAANGIPHEVAEIMTGGFGRPELLFAVPEHKTSLPGGKRESQSDILALVRHEAGLAFAISFSIALHQHSSKLKGSMLRWQG